MCGTKKARFYNLVLQISTEKNKKIKEKWGRGE
jgi:hypothetical protein